MQPAPSRNPPRAPGSFSPLPGSNSNNQSATSSPRLPPPPRRVSSFSSDDTTPLNVVKARNAPTLVTSSSTTPIYASFTANSSTTSLNQQQHNFSRPALSTAQAAARSVAGAYSPSDRDPGSAKERSGMSPLSLNPPTSATSLYSPSVASFSSSAMKGHSRKHSASAGMFDSTLPSTSTSNLSQIGTMGPPEPRRELSASQIAAQAAVRNLSQQSIQPVSQNQQQQNQQQQSLPQHARQRSQTVPAPGGEYDGYQGVMSRSSRGGGPLSPPLLSLTEASAPKESGFGNQGYYNGLLGSSTAAAAAAANVVFPRSGQSSPKLPSPGTAAPPQPYQPPPPVPVTNTSTPADNNNNNNKPLKAEKSKVKLFSRPGKIGIKSGDPGVKPLPSPGKALGQALSNLQRGNFSTTSLDSSANSLYSVSNSSAITIKASEQPHQPPPFAEKEGKEKKHHFLSRGKHKLKDKDDFHLPLSSASSNSRPVDPNAPTSLYNFNLPPSPGPNSGFKKMSDLGRHGKKKEEKMFDDAASSYAPSSYTTNTTSSGYGDSSYGGIGHFQHYNSGHSSSELQYEPFNGAKYGVPNMTTDDAWPFLRAQLLKVFEGDDLRNRIPIEELGAVVRMHIQFCLARRNPQIIIDDMRDMLLTGFMSLDQTVRRTTESRLPHVIVDMWMMCYTKILPFMQGVFVPLDLEFEGKGTIMTKEQARDFWGEVRTTERPKVEKPVTLDNKPVYGPPRPPHMQQPTTTFKCSLLETRRMVLYAFRDIIILPRFDILKTMFSNSVLSVTNLSMSDSRPMPTSSSHLASSLGSSASYLSTSPSDSVRPPSSMDAGMGSYTSTGSTLLGDAASFTSRSRGISNASYGSDSGGRPGSSSAGGQTREQTNSEDSKHITDMVARMLQCLSIISTVGYMGGILPDEGTRDMEELNKLLKLNWLGRGRTGRNRRGIVGGRVRRGTTGVVPEEDED